MKGHFRRGRQLLELFQGGPQQAKEAVSDMRRYTNQAVELGLGYLEAVQVAYQDFMGKPLPEDKRAIPDYMNE